MKAAIYARYSTDKQSATSIEDQIELVKTRLEAQGHEVVDIFSDHAMSGSSAARPDFRRMMGTIKSGHADFDMIAAEALDRLSRNQADIARLYEDLTYLDIKLWTAEEGEVDELHIGLKGTMNALFLKTLKEKIRRGQAGQVRRGKVPCNKAYGYDVVKEFDAKGELIRGERKINEVEAKIVQEIFEDYASGISPRAIAKKLNGQGIASPQGGIWRASTINGNRKRKMGFLHNELYIGKLIYNRVRMVKDPNTGKRVSRSNPESEWVTEDVPHLRIIAQAIWDKVQERKNKYANQRPEQSNRSRTLIQGLVICDECGGKYTQKNKDYIYCMNAKEAGTCSNKKGIKRKYIEDKLLSSLSSILNDQHFIEIFTTEFETALKALTSGELESVKAAENKLKDLDRQIENIIDAIAEGISTPAMKQKLLKLSSEREMHESSIINSIPAIKIPSQTDIQNRYNDILLNLDNEKLQAMDEINRKKMIEQIRDMTSKISIHPNKDQNKPKITFEGDIKTLISLTFQGADQKLQQAMVAEEGFEPPTHGL